MAIKSHLFILVFFWALAVHAQEVTLERKPSKALKEIEHLIRENKCDEANAAINKIISVDKNQQEVYELKAMIHECLGEHREAETDYSALVHMDPENAEYLFSRGALRYKLGLYQEAIDDFYSAANAPFRETQKVYFHQKPGDTGVSGMSTVSTMTTESSNFIGLSFLQLMQYDSAISHFTKAINQTPKAEYYNNRALAYEETNQTNLALNDYERSLEIADYNPETLFNLIRLYGDQGNLKRQQTLIEKLETQKELPELKVLKGVSAFNSKDYQTAVKEYSKAIQLDEDNEWYYLYRGQAYTKIKKYPLAMDDLTKAVELNATFPEAYFSIGNLYYDRNIPDSALIHYDLAILYNPDYGNAYMNRGLTKLRKKQTEEACMDLKMADQLGVSQAQKFIHQKCKDQ